MAFRSRVHRNLAVDSRGARWERYKEARKSRRGWIYRGLPEAHLAADEMFDNNHLEVSSYDNIYRLLPTVSEDPFSTTAEHVSASSSPLLLLCYHYYHYSRPLPLSLNKSVICTIRVSDVQRNTLFSPAPRKKTRQVLHALATGSCSSPAFVLDRGNAARDKIDPQNRNRRPLLITFARKTAEFNPADLRSHGYTYITTHGEGETRRGEARRAFACAATVPPRVPLPRPRAFLKDAKGGRTPVESRRDNDGISSGSAGLSLGSLRESSPRLPSSLPPLDLRPIVKARGN